MGRVGSRRPVPQLFYGSTVLTSDSRANLFEHLLGRLARVLSRKVLGQLHDPSVGYLSLEFRTHARTHDNDFRPCGANQNSRVCNVRRRCHSIAGLPEHFAEIRQDVQR
jgi:hypothetical protein